MIDLIVRKIKGKKKVEREEKLEKFLTEEERFKLTLYSFLCISAPFLFTYFFLVLNESLILFNTRFFYYFLQVIIITFSIYFRGQKILEYYEIALNREKKI